MLMEGGKVIASGTYGCILKPALPCRGETHRPEDTVSKLMIKQHAEDEMKEIQTIFKKVKNVPNFSNYYILDKIRLCEPSRLRGEDLKDFDAKCTAMKRKKIKSNMVNYPQILDGLRILQLPDGGKDISYYFSRKHSPELLVRVNNAIIKLFKGGILPLNTINVLHLDIKSSNMVYSDKSNKARLIDWGLSINIKGNTVPKSVRGWPVVFNQPFTNIIFHPQVQKIFKGFQMHGDVKRLIQQNPGADLKSILFIPLQETLMNIIFRDDRSVVREIGGLGHLAYLESVLKDIVSLNFPGVSPTFINLVKHSPFKTMGSIVSAHVAKAFLDYSIVENKLVPFREKDFFNQVYRHNCDIWGFISTYVDIIKNKHLSNTVRGKGYYIVKKYLLDNTYASVAYAPEEVINDCHSLDTDLVPGVRHSPPKSVEQPKAPILVSQTQPLKKDKFTWSLTRRCPKGTRRNKKTGKCEKPGTQKTVKKKCPPGTRRNPKTKRCNKIPVARKSSQKRKRCPNGTRRNPKTGNCEPK